MNSRRRFIRGAYVRPPLYGHHRFLRRDQLEALRQQPSEEPVEDEEQDQDGESQPEENGDDSSDEPEDESESDSESEGEPESDGEPEVEGEGEPIPSPDAEDADEGEGEDEGEGDDDSGDEVDVEDDEIDVETEDDGYGGDETQYELPPAPRVIRTLPGLEHRTGLVLRNFDNWYDFVECVNDDSLHAAKYRASHENDSEWSGTDTFEEAVDMALGRGWPEGRELMSESLIAVRPTPKAYESFSYDVAGAFPMIPMFVAGDPGHMTTIGNENVMANPIIRIDYNNTATADVPAKALMLRGAAIVSLCDDLEARGYSVEIRLSVRWKAGWRLQIMHRTAPLDHFGYQVVFKRAGEAFDLDRAVFALAQPAVMRRFGFALIEQHAELLNAYGKGYGTTCDERIDNDPNIIFIPGPECGETPESARKAVANAAQRCATLKTEFVDVGAAE